MKRKQFFTLLTVLLLLIVLLSGCSQKAAITENYAPAATIAATKPASGTSADRYYNAAGDYEAVLDSGSKTPEAAMPVNQKLIRRSYLEAETENMDALLESVYQRIAELEGYIESRNIRKNGNYRYADLTIRIPADRLDQFVNHVSGVSNITSNRETTEDVTLSYVATESRIIALETEEARLLELLAKAKDMSDLLLIESRLTEVRAELEQVKSQLRLYDNLVSYSTVTLSISEVREYTVVEEDPETVWERISTGFVKSLKGLWKGITEVFVFLVVGLPYYGTMILLVLIIVFADRAWRKKKQQKRMKTAKPIQTDCENKPE